MTSNLSDWKKLQLNCNDSFYVNVDIVICSFSVYCLLYSVLISIYMFILYKLYIHMCYDFTYLYFPCIDINKMITLMWKDHIDILPPYKIIFNNYRYFTWYIENGLWKKSSLIQTQTKEIMKNIKTLIGMPMYLYFLRQYY